MAARKHITSETYAHPDDPSGWLKPDEPLMAGGYDFAWCYVVYRDIRPGYRVGSNGSVWSCVKQIGLSSPGGGSSTILTDHWHRLKPRPDGKGYLRVGLGRRIWRSVHQLVLEAFIGPCPIGLECRHFPDRNRANNRLENIQWGTPEQNAADRVIHGTVCNGEANGRAILTEADVIEVLAMRAAGKSPNFIARWFGVGRNTINDVLHRRTWCHITDEILAADRRAAAEILASRSDTDE